MIRVATRTLLIAVILGCPLVSLSEAGGGLPGSDSCCADTRRGPDEPTGNCPNEPPSDHDPKNCLCGGAILEAASEQPTWHAELPAFPLVAAVLGTLVTPAGVDITGSDSLYHSRVPLSGRQILALIERLQL